MRGFRKISGWIRRGGALLLSAALLAGGCPMSVESAENVQWQLNETATVEVADHDPFRDSGGKPYPRAESGVYVIFYTHENRTEYHSFTDSGSYYRFWVGEGNKKTIAYCIERGVHLSTGDQHAAHGTDCDYFTTALPETTQNGIALASVYGWQGNSEVLIDGVTADDWQLATQIIIWEYQQLIRSSPTQTQDNVQAGVADPLVIQKDLYYNQIKGRAAEKAYQTILNRMEQHEKVLSFAGGSEPLVMKWNASKNRYELTVTDENEIDINWQVSGSDKVHLERSGNRYTFYTTEILEKAEQLTLTKKFQKAGSALIWESDNKQTLLTGAVQPEKISCKVALCTEGTLRLKKTSEDDVVSGVRLHIVGKGVDETVTTGEGGTVELSLPEGEYSVSEIAESKYVQPQTQKITVKKGETAEVRFANTLKKFRVSVTKKDSETATAQGGASLAGAVYGLYQDGKLVEQCTTDGEGKFTSGYHPCDGVWTLKEIKPSEGYQLDETAYSIDTDTSKLTDELNTLELDVKENVILGQISILKTAEDPAPDWYGTPPKVESETESEPESKVSSTAESEPESEPESGSAVVTSESAEEHKAAENSELAMVTRPEVGAEFQIYLTSAGSYENAGDSVRDLLVTDASGAAVSKQLPYGEYTVHQTAGEAGKAFANDLTVTISEHGQVREYALNDAALSSKIKVRKVDADSGEAITAGGMEFQITSQYSGTPITLGGQTSFITDNTGTALLPSELPAGDYQLIEIAAPNGYVLSSTPVPFTVTGNETEVELTVKNSAQLGKIKITKMGSVLQSVTSTDGVYQLIWGDETLSGAVYQVLADEDIVTGDGVVHAKKGSIVAMLTTDENGEAESDPLHLGKYRLKEISAPVGYLASSDETPVTLSYAGQTVAVTETAVTLRDDRQTAEILLRKSFAGGDGKEAYQAVRFGLFAAEDITAQDGTVLSAGALLAETGLYEDNGKYYGDFTGSFPFGSYFVRELATHGDYRLNSEKFPITLTPTETAECITVFVNDGKEIVNYRKPPKGITGSVQLTKTDAATGLTLSGAVFEIFTDTNGNARLDSADVLTGTMTELANGVHRYENLPEGGYFVKERTAPQGYTRDEAAYYFAITEDGQEITVSNCDGTFVNEPEVPIVPPSVGAIKITKTAEGGDADGFEIEVKSTDGSYCKVFVTPKEGIITASGLTPGEYTVTELETERSRAYQIPPAVTVTVTAGETAEVELYNALLPQAVPKTGDNRHVLLWGGLGLCAAIALAAVVILSKKNHSHSP